MVYWKNQRGLTIIEMVATTVIIIIVSTMGLSAVKDARRKSLRTEAKLNLQTIHVQQKREKFENGQFHPDIDKVFNPQGILRYNIGFENDLTAKDGDIYRFGGGTSSSSGNNNLWELCRGDFKAELDGTVKSSFCAFRLPDDSASFTPPQITLSTFSDAIVKPLPLTSPPTPPIEYKMYAIGNLFEDDNVPEDSGHLDIWSMDQDGVLDNCKSPWDDDDSC